MIQFVFVEVLRSLITQSCFWKRFERKVRQVCVILLILATSGTYWQNYIKMLLWICVKHRFMVTKVHILIIFLQNKDLIARTNIRVQHFRSCKNLSFNPCRKFSVLRLFCSKKTIESWYKTNCDFETAILHYIDGYILRIGLRRSRDSAQYGEYIFFQLAVIIMQNCRLKIAVSLYESLTENSSVWFNSRIYILAHIKRKQKR